MKLLVKNSFSVFPILIYFLFHLLLFYLGKEGVQLLDSTLDTLLAASKGDMRKAVTFLQSCHQLTTGKKAVVITPEMVLDVSGEIPSGIMDKLWKAFSQHSFDVLKEAVNEIVYMGFPMAMVLSQIHDMVVVSSQISDLNKALICEKLAEVLTVGRNFFHIF
jgi:replication factor C subunit 2/4